MNLKLAAKLKDLPKSPGVYFHKNKAGDIIYIGKAAVLKNRVHQYFQNSRNRDPKTNALVAEIADVDWIEVETELDALFVEAEYIRRYMPPYNIMLRDDKSMAYVRINYDDQHPTVRLTRRPLDDGARYFGPYFSAFTVKRALRYLRRVFPYSTHTNAIPKRACLQYHLGLCPGLEADKTSLKDYRDNLKKLMRYLTGERLAVIKQVEREMRTAAKQRDFEAAAAARNQLFALKGLRRQIVFSDREFMDMSKDEGLSGLAKLLELDTIPRRIEGYDISHMQGTDNVASMVAFVSGVPDKASYRKFNLRIPGNDDFAHMAEVITRRLAESNRKSWGLPDLLLIDGGKGQVNAALQAMRKAGLDIPTIGLAKRIETIIVPRKLENGNWKMEEVNLLDNSHVLKLLQRIRDESHRFAVSYHSVLKTKRQTASLLDDIPTIGPVTRKKLLRTFGSMRGITQAQEIELEKAVGPQKAKILRQYLGAN